MSISDWMSFPIFVVGLIAAIAALGTWADARRRPRPELNVMCQPIATAPGWFRITLQINNTTDVRWAARSLTVRAPATARLVNQHDAQGKDNLGGLLFSPTAAEAHAARRIVLEMVSGVAGASAAGHFADYRATQRVSEYAFITPGQPLPVTASLLLILASEEPVPRVLRVPMRVHLTPGRTA